MIRNCSLSDISDGKLYEINDLVKADCNGCKNCAKCCSGMGNSIILDPFDIFRLTKSLNKDFTKLLNQEIELNVVDGLILPNLKMDNSTDKCKYLNDEGRCSIHEFRPSICRLFPLGRFYENQGFKYFMQVHECPYEGKTKVKVKKWIDIQNIKENDKFINKWHSFILNVQKLIAEKNDDEFNKKINMYILNQFYICKYDIEKDFYTQFDSKMDEAKALLVTVS